MSCLKHLHLLPTKRIREVYRPRRHVSILLFAIALSIIIHLNAVRAFDRHFGPYPFILQAQTPRQDTTMSSLHKALEILRPKDFADVPLDDLPSFLSEVFKDAELIANSVPIPPGGNSFLSSQRSRSEVNSARSAAEITNSSARPPPPDPSHAALQGSWGKPLKIGAKDNVLGVSVYKMAGNDRHGAWFARRSVHEGLGFTKWKKAMQQEFLESLAVQGGPGEGNVRGIGSDKRVERRSVNGVGTLEGRSSSLINSTCPVSLRYPYPLVKVIM